MANNNIQFGIGINYNVDESSLKKLQASLQQIIKLSEQPGKEMDTELKKAAQSAKLLQDSLSKAYNAKLGTTNITKLNNELKKSGTSIAECRTNLQGIGTDGAKAFNLLGSQILGANVKIKETNKWMDKLATTFGNTIRYQISTTVFNKVTGSIQQAVGYAEDLDESLNHIRIVSGQSADQMQDFAKQANEASKALGSTTLDYTDASLIYYQQGLSTDEVVERTNATIKMANVLGTSSQEVSDYMTAVWNNFDDGSKSLEYYGDVITKLGASTASSAEEIAEGLEKFAAIGDTVGLSYEYATASLATVVAQTRQSADTVGTAFKTLFARIQDLELGETLDDGTTLGKYSKALAAVGVNIKDQNGQLKDMNIILDEMGEKWTTLSKDEQTALAQTVAGTRQYTQLVALMDNWGEVQKNIQIAADAEGTLNEQNEIFLQSTEAHLNKLRTTAQELYGDLIKTDELNAGIDAVTNLVQVIENFVSSLGGGIQSITLLGIALANIFNKQISNGIVNMIDSLSLAKSQSEQLKTTLEQIDMEASKVDSSTTAGRTAEVGYTKQREELEKINGLTKNITQEQQNEVIEIAKKNKELAIQNTLLQEGLNKSQNKNAGLQFNGVNIQEDINKQINSASGNGDLTDSVKSDFELKASEYQALAEDVASEEFRNKVAMVAGSLKDTVDAIVQEEVSKNAAETDIANYEMNLLGDADAEEEIRKLREELTQSDTTIKDLKINAEEFEEQLKDIAEEYNLDSKQLRKLIGNEEELNKYLDKEVQKREQIAEAYKRGMSQADIFQQIKDNEYLSQQNSNRVDELAEQARMNQTVSGSIKEVTGAVTALASGYSTLISASNTFKSYQEGTISFGQMVSQMVMTVIPGFTLMAKGALDFATSLGTTSSAITRATASIGLLSAAKAADATTTKILVGIENEEFATVMRAVAAKKLSAKEIKTETGLRAIEEILKEKDIKLTDELTIKELQEAIANKAASGSIWGLVKAKIADTAATLGLEAAMAPLLITIGAVVAALAAFTIAYKHHNAEMQAQVDASNELVKEKEELLNKTVEEKEKVDSLAESYRELRESYDKNLTSEQDFKTKAIEICKQLGLQSEIVKILAGDYDDLEEAISSAQSTANEEVIKNADAEMAEASAAMSASFAKGTGLDVAKGVVSTENPNTISVRRGIKISDWDANASIEQSLEDKLGESYDNFQSLASFSLGDEIGNTPEKQYEIYQAITEVLKENAQYANSAEYQQLSELANNMKTGAEAWEAALNTKQSAEFQNELIKLDFSNPDDSIDDYLDKIEQAKEKAKEFDLDEETTNVLLDSYLSKNGQTEKYNRYLQNEGVAQAFGKDIKEVEEELDDLSENGRKYFYLNFDKYDSIESAKEAALAAQESGVANIEAEITYFSNTTSILGKVSELDYGAYDFTDEIYAMIESNQGLMDKINSEIEGGYQGFKEDLNLEEKKAVIEDYYQYMAQKYTDDSNAEKKAALESYNEELKLLSDKKEAYEENEKKYLEVRKSDPEREAARTQQLEYKKQMDDYLVGEHSSEDEIYQEYKKNFDAATKRIQARDEELKIQFGVEVSEEELNQQIDDINEKIKNLDLEDIDFNAVMHFDTTELENANKKLDEIQASYKTLKSAQDDYNKEGFLTTDNLQSLLALGPQYINTLEIQNGQLTINKEAYVEATKAQYAKIAADEAELTMSTLLAAYENNDPEAKAKIAAANYIAADTSMDLADSLLAQAEAYAATKKGTDEYIEGTDEFIEAARKRNELIKEGMKGVTVANYDKVSGASSTKKSKKDTKKYDDEFNRYHDLEEQLEKIENTLKRIDKIQEHVFGKQLIQSLQNENKVLAQQAAQYQKIAAAKKARQAELQQELGKKGMTFDASGNIANYASATSSALQAYNNAVSKYNAGKMTDDAFKKYEDQYNSFKKLVTEYDKLNDELDDVEEKLYDISQQVRDNNLKAWEVQLELNLNTEVMTREWNEFIKTINEDFKSVYTNYSKEMKSIQSDMDSYLRGFNPGGMQLGSGTIGTDIQAALEVEREIDKIMSGQGSSMFASLSEAQEKLKELYETLKTDTTEVYNLYKKAYETLLSDIDQYADKWDDLSDKFKQLSEELEFQAELIELIYGDKAYGLLDSLYTAQQQVSMGQVDTYKKEYEAWKKMYQSAAEGSQEQKKYYDNMVKAQSNLKQSVLETANIIKDKMANAIKEAAYEFETFLNDTTFQDTKDQWEQLQDSAEGYFDKTEQLYKAQSLAYNIKDAIDDTKNVRAQQKLQAFYDKEVAAMREKENLSEYDVEHTEKKLELLKAEIALEDAQNAKNSMKLTRDESGNWTYQYVADESDVEDKQQALLDAAYELYELSSKAYQENLQKAQELYQTYAEKQQAIANDMTLSDEERTRKLLELDNWYYAESAKVAEANAEIRENLSIDNANLLNDLYAADVASFETMTSQQQELINTMQNNGINSYQTLEDAYKTNMDNIATKSNEVANEVDEYWDSAVQHMINKFSEDPDSFKNKMNETYQAILEANQDYQDALDELASTAGIDFSDIQRYINETQNSVAELEGASDRLTQQMIAGLNEDMTYIQAMENAWKQAQQTIMGVMATMDEYLKKQQDIANETVQLIQEQISAYKELNNAASGSTTTTTKKDSGKTENKKDRRNYMLKSLRTEGSDEIWGLYYKTGSNPTFIKEKRFSSQDSQEQVWTGFGFRTGGYTGSWTNGSQDGNGKLAFLHQKELVLNESDTQNILDAVSVVRAMTAGLQSNIGSMLGKLKTNGNISNVTNSTTDNNNNNTFEITMNVDGGDVEEIKQAILNLPNLANQYLSQNRGY